jgi:hypothetical protein
MHLSLWSNTLSLTFNCILAGLSFFPLKFGLEHRELRPTCAATTHGLGRKAQVS